MRNIVSKVLHPFSSRSPFPLPLPILPFSPKTGEINESKRIMEQKVNFLKVQSRLGLPSGWPLAPHRVYHSEGNAGNIYFMPFTSVISISLIFTYTSSSTNLSNSPLFFFPPLLLFIFFFFSYS